MGCVCVCLCVYISIYGYINNSDKRYLGLCGLYLADAASLAFKVFSHDGDLLCGEGDVVEQALVGHLTLRELLLSLG